MFESVKVSHLDQLQEQQLFLQFGFTPIKLLILYPLIDLILDQMMTILKIVDDDI